MSQTTTFNLILKKDLIKEKALANALGVMVFVTLTIIGAYIRIPLGFTPVPITLQTFFVILAGAVLGKKLGSFSQIGYLILGFIGLPVFTGAGFGLGYLAGPTGGYLIGFILCAFLVGRLIDIKTSLWWKITTFTLGLSSIFLCGILWLSFLLNITIYKSVLLGVVPFLPGALVKLTAAVLLYLRFGARIKHTFMV